MRLLSLSTLEVKRYGKTYLDEFGDVTVSPPTTFVIKCNWQPLANVQKGEMASILPEGVKITDVLNLWSTSELYVDDEVAQTVADEITIEGRVYKVHQARNWNRYLPRIKHYEYMLVRKEKR